VIVGRRSLDEGHVDGHKSPVEEVRDVRKKDWRIIGQSLIHGLSCVVRDEKRVVSKIPFEFFIRIRSETKGPHMEDFRIENGRRVRFYVLDEGTNQVLGFSAAGAHENPIALVNMAKDSLFGDEFVGEDLSPPIQPFEIHSKPPLRSQDDIRFS
jgi:hypothetical protein